MINEGQVPKDINGTFLKNGPNQRLDCPDTGRTHWFAGDGMLHALCLSNGQLYYCNRFSRTEKYKHEDIIGKCYFPYLMHFAEIGVLTAPITGVLQKIGYLKNPFK